MRGSPAPSRRHLTHRSISARNAAERPQVVARHHNARAIDERVRQAQRGDETLAAPFDRAKIDELHLILAVVDDLAQRVAAADEVSGRELAFEDRVLQVVAEVARRSPAPAFCATGSSPPSTG